jgi:hypothetical protein
MYSNQVLIYKKFSIQKKAHKQTQNVKEHSF